MILRTLGQLSLDGSDFRRAKPLLLAAYLRLEGPKSRRYLAEIFWPGASDAMNSLSVALSQLRRGAPEIVEADETRAWSGPALTCDAGELRNALSAGNLERAIELYEGAFLEGLELELGEELEEWVFASREALAGTAREALLRLAEMKAGQGRFESAGQLAERAYYLPGAAPPEPEEFVRFQVLLAAGKSPAAAELRREAEAYDIALGITTEEARARVGQVLVGREREHERLSALAEGEWVWLRGERGMGKTALLRQLNGVYLPARSGLPYATLEPLIGDSLGASETVLLQRLAGMSGTWLVDDWEQIDTESRLLLARLRTLRPLVRVVIASTDAPSLPVDAVVVLGPLPDGALGAFPDAWEQTGGLPELVGAFLREESLDEALERRLARLDERSRDVYLALSLLEEPDPALVRRALGLSSSAIGGALGELLSVGLAESSGAVRARQSARAYLEARPALFGPMALKLARQKSGIAAFPLYQRARPFWEDGDLTAVTESYLAWGEELLRRGFSRRSVETLTEAPPSNEVTLQWARALEQAGQYREALDKLSALPDSALVSALKGALYWRLGQLEEANEAAQRGLEGDAEARAEALNTLGVLARTRDEYEAAGSLTRRAAALWKALGNQMRWVGALNNLAIIRTLAGERGEDAFREALEASGKSGVLQARTLLNVGWAYEREGELGRAEGAYREAAARASDAGVTEVAAWAWNNLGVLHHKQRQPERAREAYEQALTLAQRAGEQRILGMVMANLAELTEDREAWEEALRILEKSGHETVAEDLRKSLGDDHVFQVEEGNRASRVG
jgi:tetratricopeptide (TPR) repeat protein/DNA-binding SARP family transcriptional activator